LDVGAGTFKPIDVDDLADHAMHSERFCVPAHTLHMLAEVAASRARRESRLIAVGTTSVRACESIPNDRLNQQDALIAHTRILISPGHQFRFTDGLLTNFHLPRSTLLALVGAFMGMELMHEAYAIAVRERYRFYSFGDAMLIV
jgi:S-adenosylmethionine:tRNA ribosyltransferase-isomerase